MNILGHTVKVCVGREQTSQGKWRVVWKWRPLLSREPWKQVSRLIEASSRKHALRMAEANTETVIREYQPQATRKLQKKAAEEKAESNLTVGQCYELYLARIQSQIAEGKRSSCTHYNMSKSATKLQVVWNVPIAEFGEDHIDAVKEALNSYRRKNGKQLAPKGKNTVLIDLRTVINWAYKRKRLRLYPCPPIDEYRDDRRPETLDAEDVVNISSKGVLNLRHRLWLQIMECFAPRLKDQSVECGCGAPDHGLRGELVDLTERPDAPHGSITFYQHKTRSWESTPLTPELRATLIDVRARRGGKLEGALLRKVNGEPATYGGIRRTFELICKRAGVSGKGERAEHFARTHVYRRMLVTDGFRAGLSTQMVQSAIRHKSDRAIRHYAALNLSDKTKAMEAIRELRKRTAGEIPLEPLPAGDDLSELVAEPAKKAANDNG